MPNGVSEKDDYRRNRAYYLAREGSKEGVKKREERRADRTAMIKAGKLSKHSAKEVDHINALARGGSARVGNLEVISRTANRRKYDHTPTAAEKAKLR